MSMGKKSNDATKKKGMALGDAEVENVTGGYIKVIPRTKIFASGRHAYFVTYEIRDNETHEVVGRTASQDDAEYRDSYYHEQKSKRFSDSK